MKITAIEFKKLIQDDLDMSVEIRSYTILGYKVSINFPKKLLLTIIRKLIGIKCDEESILSITKYSWLIKAFRSLRYKVSRAAK